MLTGLPQTAAFKRATLNRQYVALFLREPLMDMFQAEVQQVQGLPLRFRNNTYDRVKDVKLVKMMTTVSERPGT